MDDVDCEDTNDHGYEETDDGASSFEDTDDSEEYRAWTTTMDPRVWTTASNLTDE